MKLALLLMVPALLLAACTRSGPTQAQVREDFDTICKAQKDFLQSKQLLKGVKESELQGERNRRMGEGRLSEAGLRAVELVVSSAGQSPRAAVEEEAKKAGLKDWTCPEL